ncbi:MAG TPA: M12 family metallo-peptidase [Hyphomicrobiaceae bacterium]|nr:M12 family metallo-peptidase [Hyphomicrobiaceae bacterium]
MTYPRMVAGALLLSCSIFSLSATAQGVAKTKAGDERVEIIVSQPENAGQPDRSLRGFFTRMKARIANFVTQALPMTRCEKWSVAKKDLERIKREAARNGVVITQLGADWQQLMRPADELQLDEKQRALVERAKASKSTLGVKIMKAPPPAVLEHALTFDAKKPAGKHEPAKITVSFADNTTVTIVRTSVDIKPDMVIWRGTVEEDGGQVTFMWWANGKMTGIVQGRGRPKCIRHLGGDLYAVVEMGEDRMPQEHASMRPGNPGDPTLRDDPLVRQGDASSLKPTTAAADVEPAKPASELAKAVKKAATPAAKSAAGAKDVTIDVIVAYTAKAASNYSDVKRELIDLAIEEGNNSFRMSNLGNIKLRLVHAYETSYVEQGAHFDHVWRFADKGDGYMDEIHGLRDRYKADVAVLVVDDPQGCGLATRVYAEADEAFAVVHHECAATTYSLAHEVGHLIGARHDLSLDTVMTPFPFGHGYVNGTKWRDIMSYKESCGGCPRLPVWSSPLVKVRGEVAGTPDLDNARVIGEQAGRVAAFR